MISKLVIVDSFFPSSKTCSNCGHVQNMPLNVRTYDCPECGLSYR
ncbi:zinc ribbon domain-containing protein [Dapis sp. BLCC M126]